MWSDSFSGLLSRTFIESLCRGLTLVQALSKVFDDVRRTVGTFLISDSEAPCTSWLRKELFERHPIMFDKKGPGAFEWREKSYW